MSSLVGCGIGGISPDPTHSSRLNNNSTVRKCDKWMAERGGLVSKSKPDVVLLLRANVNRDPVEPTNCDPDYRKWLDGVVRSEVEELGATGAVVVVASRMYVRMGNKASTESDDVTDCVNSVIRGVTDSAPNAVYLPLNEWVCPTRETCQRVLDDVTLRPDGLHFQGRGSTVAATWIFQKLFG